MKKKIGRFLKIIAFCALLAVAVAGVSRLVERKESREKMQPFLSRAGEYDVLFLGDSIMNTGVFPMEIWEKYGIAGYNIASYGNTLPITYWALQNALDYAAPKLVVLDVQGVSKSYKVSGNSSDVHTAFDCYPVTKTKIRTMNDLMDDPDAVDDSGTALRGHEMGIPVHAGQISHALERADGCGFPSRIQPGKGREERHRRGRTRRITI